MPRPLLVLPVIIAAACNITDDYPSLTTPELSPDVVTTDTPLLATVELTDPQDKELTLLAELAVDGLVLTRQEVGGLHDGESATVEFSPEWYSKGQQVQVVANVRSGRRGSLFMPSEIIAIANSAPEAGTPVITSSEQGLVCALPEPPTDADDDPLSEIVSWKRDGEDFPDAETTDVEGDTIAAADLSSGASWTCLWTLSDDETFTTVVSDPFPTD